MSDYLDDLDDEEEIADWGIFETSEFDPTEVPAGWYHVEKDNESDVYEDDEAAARAQFHEVAYWNQYTGELHPDPPSPTMEIATAWGGIEEVYPWWLVASRPRTEEARDWAAAWDAEMQRRNPPRARRNLPRALHGKMAGEYRAEHERYGRQAEGAWNDGDVERFRRVERAGLEALHKANTHQMSAGSEADARRYVATDIANLRFATRPPAAQNPPATGKWERKASGHVLRGQGKYAAVLPYKPRHKGAQGVNARRVAGVYEAQKGQKVPKGTKYLALLEWYGGPMVEVLGAHKTLKAAKAAGSKALGVKVHKPRKRRARKNPSAYTVQVKTSSRAQPRRVKLPSSAKPETVKGRVIHRSVSYAGGKLRLLKGWTVSSKAGIGMAKFKTKAAAERYARGR